MVSFQCDGCADTVKKPQLDKHRNRCWAPFTCLDCSTTFHNQDYKSHTSCITEAEKYQGSLYRGPRKGQGQQGNNSNTASSKATPAASAAATPADSPAPEAAGTGGIHPSRLNMVQQGQANGGSGNDFSTGRGGFGQRGARGGFAGRGRGGFGARGGFGGAAPNPVPSRKSVTGENRTAPEGGMRTWGSAPASDAEATPAATPAPATPAATPAAEGEEKKKSKNKKKGDKGGTGAKANSRLKAEAAEAAAAAAAAAAADEPPAKKRKRDDDESASATPAAAETSEKTLKRIRKHMSKLEDKVSTAIPLAEWLAKVGQNKDKTIDQADILAGVKVAFADGRWQLSL